jgi:hypothetical protein
MGWLITSRLTMANQMKEDNMTLTVQHFNDVYQSAPQMKSALDDFISTWHGDKQSDGFLITPDGNFLIVFSHDVNLNQMVFDKKTEQWSMECDVDFDIPGDPRPDWFDTSDWSF